MNTHRAIGKSGSMEPVGCTTVLRMCSDFHTQIKAACGLADIPLLNVALAYEDAQAGNRAVHTFRNLFSRNEDSVRLNMRNVWKFEFLALDQLREAAVGETICADLVIVSMNKPSELPGPVKCWLEESFRRREGDPGAVVLLHQGMRTPGDIPPAEAYMARCASNAGLDFFVKGAAHWQGTAGRQISPQRDTSPMNRLIGLGRPAMALCRNTPQRKRVYH